MLSTGTVHSHEDDLDQYVCGRLEPQDISSLESHLLECPACREKLSHRLCLKLSPGSARKKPGRTRSEPRFNTGDSAVFQELNPLSLVRQTVQIVDVSKSGLGILAPNPVFPGTIVQIRIKNEIELGEVRHCSGSAGKGYRVGLRLLLWVRDQPHSSDSTPARNARN